MSVSSARGVRASHTHNVPPHPHSQHSSASHNQATSVALYKTGRFTGLVINSVLYYYFTGLVVRATANNKVHITIVTSPMRLAQSHRTAPHGAITTTVKIPEKSRKLSYSSAGTKSKAQGRHQNTKRLQLLQEQTKDYHPTTERCRYVFFESRPSSKTRQRSDGIPSPIKK